jgi:hypothetical protein
MRSHAKLVSKFLVQVATGTMLFIVIAIPALALSFLASSDLIASTSRLMATIFEWLSKLVILIDTFLLLIILYRALITALRTLWAATSEGSE